RMTGRAWSSFTPGLQAEPVEREQSAERGSHNPNVDVVVEVQNGTSASWLKTVKESCVRTIQDVTCVSRCPLIGLCGEPGGCDLGPFFFQLIEVTRGPVSSALFCPARLVLLLGPEGCHVSREI